VPLNHHFEDDFSKDGLFYDNIIYIIEQGGLRIAHAPTNNELIRLLSDVKAAMANGKRVCNASLCSMPISVLYESTIAYTKAIMACSQFGQYPWIIGFTRQ